MSSNISVNHDIFLKSNIFLNICYIIKEWFFHFNYFSLIIFYHSVWLGFELFGLRVQVCSQLVQFTLVPKWYDNHHCHNKPQTENGAGVWMMLCPEEMGLEFGRFWKRWSCEVGVRPWCWEVEVWLCSWGFEIGPCRQTIEFLPLGQRIEFSTIELSFLPLRR